MAFRRDENNNNTSGGSHKKFRRYFEVDEVENTNESYGSGDSKNAYRHNSFTRSKRNDGETSKHGNKLNDMDEGTYNRNGEPQRKFKRYFEDNECDESYDTSNRGYGQQKSSSRRNRTFDYDNQNQHGQTKSVNYMDDESKTYFNTVLNRMNELFEDDEEKEMFLENVVEQILENETTIALTSLGGKTIQKALELNTKVEVIDKLLVHLQNDIETLSNNQYASITLQCLLINCLKYVQADNTSKHITDFVLATAELCTNNIPFNVNHPFQNYILKTVIHVLAGNIGFSSQTKRLPFTSVFVSVPLEFQEAFQKLTQKFLSTENFSDYLHENIFSVVVQHVIQSAGPFPEICKAIADTILNIFLRTESTDGSLHPLLTNNSSRLVEAIADIMNAKQHRKFMKKYILKNLKTIIEDKYANNVLRTMIKTTTKKENFEKLVKKLEPYFKLIFDTDHHSLFVAIADRCIHFDTCQAGLVVALKDVLQCTDGNKQDYFVLCVLHMLPYKQYVKAESENSVSVTLNGSLLIQRMLSFSKPIKIAMAIINMSSDNLKRILCDPKGCHVTDAFMNSKFIGEKSHEKFIAKVKDIAALLACSAHGSRSIDAIWALASLKHKIMLAEPLSKNIEVLASNQFGKFINKKLALNHFKNRVEEWKQIQTSQDRKRKLFKDILETPDQEKTKKYKN